MSSIETLATLITIIATVWLITWAVIFGGHRVSDDPVQEPGDRLLTDDDLWAAEQLDLRNARREQQARVLSDEEPVTLSVLYSSDND